METTSRTRWRYFEIRMKTDRYTAFAREPDPERALTAARWRIRAHGPALPDPINEPDATARLVGGETLTAHCLDGTTVTVEPFTT
jgi:hypothetical protein